ncbi:MAG: hypothetical protein Tsb0032_13840 [Kiloniellaceae bacterium]
MNRSFAFTGLALAVGLAACAQSDGPLGPNRLRAVGLDVADGPRVNVRYPAVLSYEVNGDVRIIEGCYRWSATKNGPLWSPQGPYCFDSELGGGANTVSSMLATGYPGTYRLEGYVRYVADGVARNSNRVATEITVIPRL